MLSIDYKPGKTLRPLGLEVNNTSSFFINAPASNHFILKVYLKNLTKVDSCKGLDDRVRESPKFASLNRSGRIQVLQSGNPTTRLCHIDPTAEPRYSLNS